MDRNMIASTKNLEPTHRYILAVCTEEGDMEIFGFPTTADRDTTLEEFIERFGDSFRFAIADIE